MKRRHCPQENRYAETVMNMRAWIVRGGAAGGIEQTALGEGLVAVSWDLFEDLSLSDSVAEIADALRAIHPDESAATITNWAHQLWRFVHAMQVGDLVVMPRKSTPVVAIGRITGDYAYRPEVPEGLQHSRPVEWLATEVERAAVKGDLRDSMGSLLTVSELSRRDAVNRVKALAETGEDPGYEGHVEPPTDFQALKEEVEEKGTRQLSVRDLIGLGGWNRRTTEVIDLVDGKLADLGLVVEPPFTTVQLNDLVTVSALDAVAPSSAERPAQPKTADAVPEAGIVADLTWRVGNVTPSQDVVTVMRDEPLGRAFERMVANDYSQLPVVDRHRRLEGVITWESVAHALVPHRQEVKTVEGAMVADQRSAHESDELFGRIDEIKKHGFLIIVDGENVVIGILTAADMAGELRDRVEPFTVLEEIERRLRRAVAPLSVEDLRGSYRRGDSRAERIKSPHDLTLGSYRFLLDDEDRWNKLRWPYDRENFVERLRKVADFRNSVAHWSVDALGHDSVELKEAKELLKLLKVVDKDPS
jgi:restriction system protein